MSSSPGSFNQSLAPIRCTVGHLMGGEYKISHISGSLNLLPEIDMINLTGG